MTTLLLQSLLSAPLVAPIAMSTDPPAPVDQRISLLGLQVCIGEPQGGTCHVKLPAPTQEAVAPKREGAEPKPVALTVFGKTLCFGEVADGTTCDLHFKGEKPQRDGVGA